MATKPTWHKNVGSFKDADDNLKRIKWWIDKLIKEMKKKDWSKVPNKKTKSGGDPPKPTIPPAW